MSEKKYLEVISGCLKLATQLAENCNFWSYIFYLKYVGELPEEFKPLKDEKK